jgi:hypothetical protein
MIGGKHPGQIVIQLLAARRENGPNPSIRRCEQETMLVGCDLVRICPGPPIHPIGLVACHAPDRRLPPVVSGREGKVRRTRQLVLRNAEHSCECRCRDSVWESKGGSQTPISTL